MIKNKKHNKRDNSGFLTLDERIRIEIRYRDGWNLRKIAQDFCKRSIVECSGCGVDHIRI